LERAVGCSAKTLISSSGGKRRPSGRPTKITPQPDPRHPPVFPATRILQPISDQLEVALATMKIMLLLILISLLLAAGFLLAYLRAVRDGQFDDDYTPAIRILFDDSISEKTQDDDPTPHE
jgi:cbb3-type cytochrome oxidase maturation protein